MVSNSPRKPSSPPTPTVTSSCGSFRRISYAPLRTALPAVGLLGRFDPDLLRAALPQMSDFDEMFSELRQQEWISRRGPDYYEIDEALRRRLLAYCEQSASKQVGQAYELVAEHLEKLTADDPLDSLLPFHFDTTMRVLQRDPVKAARWWAQAEARFAREDRYEWARQLVEFMLEAEGACAEADPYGDRPAAVAALRAGVLATQQACLLHTRPGADRTGGWQDVRSLLAQYPDADLAEKLEFRAVAGIVATSSLTSTEPPPQVAALAELVRQVSLTDPEVVAAFVAAAEALVERAEQEREPGGWLDAAEAVDPVTASRLLVEYVLPASSRIVHPFAFMGSLAGRLTLIRRDFDNAEQLLRDAVGFAVYAGEPHDGRWLDWRAPDDLLARVRLEFLRGTYPAILDAERALEVIPRTPDESLNVDTDRLASAVLTIRAAIAPVSVSSLLLLGSDRIFRSQCNAHRAFPPLAICQVQALAGTGKPDDAIRLLDALRHEWERSGENLEALAECQLATLRIIRRMRLRDEGFGLESGRALSGDLASTELRWSLDGLDGAKAVSPSATGIRLDIAESADRAAWYHARWRTLCTSAWPPEAVADFAAEMATLSCSEPTFAALSLELDLVESALTSFAEARRSKPSQAQDWWSGHPHQPEEALRLLLRSAAILGAVARRATVPRALISRLGRRRAAQIAFDEGEMLALRLPERAWPIVELAGEWFAECGDVPNSVIAPALSAVLAGRAGHRESLIFLLGRLRGDLASLEHVSPWSELEKFANAPAPAVLDRLGPQGWRPWLIRIVACEVWASHSSKRLAAVRRLQDWIDAHYGTVQRASAGARAPQVAAPAELDGWHESNLPTVGFTLRNYLGSLGFIFSSVLRPLVTVLSPAALFSVIGSLIYSAATAKTRSVMATLALTSESAGDDAIGIVLADGTQNHASQELVKPSADEPYQRLPAVLPAGLIAEIDKLGRARRNRRRVLELQLDAGLAGPCWEAALAGPAGAPDVSSLLRVVRTVPSRRARAARPWRDLKSVVSIVADLKQDSMVTLGWQDLAGRRRYRYQLRRPDEVYGDDTLGEDIDIVHIVGTPIDTASGPRLDIGRLTGEQYSSSTSGPPRGELMQAADIRRLFAGVTCCVLQGTPHELTNRTVAERRQAQNLRIMAEEIFSLGVMAVITVPPLPSSLAAAVLEELSKAITRRPAHPVIALADAIREAAARIAAVPELAAEAPFDLCLYASDAR